MSIQKTNAPLAVSPAKAGDMLGLSPQVIRRLISTGKLFAIRVDKRIIIPIESIKNFLSPPNDGKAV